MKFHELPIGSRFIADQQEYRKTSPVLAESLKDNKPRLFPRSFEVRSAQDSPASKTDETKETLNNEQVITALETFHQSVVTIINSLGLDPANSANTHNALAQARQQCLHTLGIADTT